MWIVKGEKKEVEIYMLPREKLAVIDKAVDSIAKKLVYRDGVFVETDSIIQAVSDYTKTKISFSYASFSTLIPKTANYGAIMCVTKWNEGAHKQHAQIILNDEKDLKFRRFSLVHELGHLATGEYNLEEKENQFMLCAHIQYNITAIPEKVYQDDPFMEAEEIANVFALKILLPTERFAKKIFELKDISAVADSFGVTEDAVCSRSLLGL